VTGNPKPLSKQRIDGKASILATGARSVAGAVARHLLFALGVTQDNLIGVRHLKVGSRLIPVQLFRNAGGSVAGKFVLGAQDTPIVDGPTPEAVLALLRDVLDGLLLARKARVA
jgi:hypothetical protein